MLNNTNIVGSTHLLILRKFQSTIIIDYIIILIGQFWVSPSCDYSFVSVLTIHLVVLSPTVKASKCTVVFYCQEIYLKKVSLKNT